MSYIKKINIYLKCITFLFLSVWLGNTWLYAHDYCDVCTKLVNIYKDNTTINQELLNTSIVHQTITEHNKPDARSLLYSRHQIPSPNYFDYSCSQDKLSMQLVMPRLASDNFHVPIDSPIYHVASISRILNTTISSKYCKDRCSFCKELMTNYLHFQTITQDLLESLLNYRQHPALLKTAATFDATKGYLSSNVSEYTCYEDNLRIKLRLLDKRFLPSSPLQTGDHNTFPFFLNEQLYFLNTDIINYTIENIDVPPS